MSSRGAKERQKSFKKGIDIDADRRRREETTVQLRKSKREDSLQKKRREVAAEAPGAQVGGVVAPVPAIAGGIQDLQELLAAISTNDRAVQKEATVKFRKLLSIGKLPDPTLFTCLGSICFVPKPLLTCSRQSGTPRSRRSSTRGWCLVSSNS